MHPWRACYKDAEVTELCSFSYKIPVHRTHMNLYKSQRRTKLDGVQVFFVDVFSA